MHTATGQPWKLVITIEYSSAEGAHVHVVSESRFWPRSLRDDCSLTPRCLFDSVGSWAMEIDPFT